MEQGVPQEDILIENRSRTTFENLTFSKAILENQGLGKSVLVVTKFLSRSSGWCLYETIKNPWTQCRFKNSFLLSPIGLDPRDGLG